MTGMEPTSAPHDPDLVEFVPAPARRRPSWRLVGALLCFAASILALLSSFLTLFTTTVRIGPNGQLIVTITAWDIRAENDGQPFPAGAIPENGAPLLVAATLLLAAALLGLFANAVPSRLGIGRANIVLAAVGASFLAGTTLTLGMQELAWLELFRPRDPGSSGDQSMNIGIGFWLLIVATGAALVSVVFAGLPARSRPGRTEPETPPLGVPVAVVHRLPDAEPDPPPDE